MSVRPATIEDAEALLRIYAPFVLKSAVSFETEVPTIEAFAQRVEETLRHYPWLVAEDEAGLLGYAYAGPHRQRDAYRWSAEASVYVAAHGRRRGVARGLYGELLSVLRCLGYHGVYAGITLPNEASVAFHQSVGFRPAGVFAAVGYKFGTWHDVGWWQMHFAPAENPVPPRSYSAVL